MIYRVIIGPDAEREIRAIVRWKSQRVSHRIANRWYLGLVRKIDTLKSQPHRCPLATENDRFPIEIREMIYGRRRDVFRIIFTIRGDEVRILFVQHAAQSELEP